MTTQEWTRTALAPHLQPDDSVRCDDGAGNVMDVPVTTFCEIFGAVIDTELTRPEGERDFYSALSAGIYTFTLEGETYSNKTAVELGYQPFFDVWHVEGLI